MAMTNTQLERLSDLLGRFYEEVNEGEGQIRYEIGVVRHRVDRTLEARIEALAVKTGR
jgi:hypothetical protein